MASVVTRLHLALDPSEAWAAIRDFGAADRLFAGVVTECRLEGRRRVVCFADGSELEEVLVTCDDDEQRMVYAAVGSTLATHHNASFETQPSDKGGALVVWTTDILPDELAEAVGERMRVGMEALERSFVEERWPPGAQRWLHSLHTDDGIPPSGGQYSDILREQHLRITEWMR